MTYENKVSESTWARNIEPINKAGYSDGVTDGQKNTFQTSFDLGYKLGLDFGLQLGYKETQFKYSNSQEGKKSPIEKLNDTRKINCQICLKQSTSQEENIINLYNEQKEINDSYLNNCKENETLSNK